MEARRRRRARSGHKNCWSCGGVGHISQDCDMCNGRGRASGELQLRTLPVVVIKSPVTEISQVEGSVGSLKSDMLVDTGITVTLAVMEFNQSSVVLWNVPISTIWLEAASGTELVVTSACVMKIELGDLV
ncbi:zinc knuckle protein [Trichinella spiralis]|uniref:zinc knuckle protein n=1 Tax=Trichinella spiralis TaxID=6334 RepID=UPI0001EFEB9E|nr:zinc knuckle protein [Trichinella spiralis]